MSAFRSELEWIRAQHDELCQLLVRWARINTGTYHLAGLARQLEELEHAFALLEGRMERRTLPPQRQINDAGEVVEQPVGEALWIGKRLDAPRQVLLSIHMDTVFGPDHPFQDVRELDGGRLQGPGVADAKGGLLVMLTALRALERSDVARHIGWQVVINPDEEIGSPGSNDLLRQCAQQCDLGLVFEPALPDGNLVAARKGSGNFTVVVRGRSAHAGRDFFHGRNAVAALATLVTAMSDLTGARPGLTVNIARIHGGGPSNMVPDLAVAHLNVRLWQPVDQRFIEEELSALVEKVNTREGFSAVLHGGFTAPPKPLDAATEKLLNMVGECGRELGMVLRWQESGGVCDGNRLAAAGLPTVDTLGVVGGAIHSSREYVELPSITQRAALTALLLLKLAAGELDWPKKSS